MCNLNDNELLYLISENDDVAKEILIEKYKPLIKSIVNKYNINSFEKEDVYQESMLCLVKAINTYNDIYNMSFNCYFTMLLKRKIVDLIRKETTKVNYSYSDCIDEMVADRSTILEEKNIYARKSLSYIFSDFEEQVYYFKYKDKLKPQEIAAKMQVDVKNIYNALRRIKGKMNEKTK